MKLVNLTPHEIVLALRAEGKDITLPPSGTVARVASTPGERVGTLSGCPVYSAPTWGAVEGIPDPVPDTVYVVSTIVAGRAGRVDVVSPGTGPADEPIRDGGLVVAVTRLIRSI